MIQVILDKTINTSVLNYAAVDVFLTNNKAEAIAAQAHLIKTHPTNHLNCAMVKHYDGAYIVSAYVYPSDSDWEINTDLNEVAKLTEEVLKSLSEPYVYFFEDDREHDDLNDTKMYLDFKRCECIAIANGSMSLKDYERCLYWGSGGTDAHGNDIQDYETKPFIETYLKHVGKISSMAYAKFLMPTDD